MKSKLLVMTLAVCVISPPAIADLFGVTVSNPQTIYNNTAQVFTANTSVTIADTLNVKQGSSLEGLSAPALGDWAEFDWYPDGTGDSGSFSLTMNISNINDTLKTAVGVGSFIFIDNDGDTITANILGDWAKPGRALSFIGTLTDVYFTAYGSDGILDTTFDGGDGPGIDMSFIELEPWSGEIIQLTASAPWFSEGDFSTYGGSIDIVVVPVPTALALGILSLGSLGIGLKLRKCA